MPAYTRDLRKRVVDAVERKEGSTRQIAHRFVISLSFVVRLLQLKRRTGSIEPNPHRGGRRPALGPADLERLRGLVQQQPDATLEELRERPGVDLAPSLSGRSPARRRPLMLRSRTPPETKRQRPAFRGDIKILSYRGTDFG